MEIEGKIIQVLQLESGEGAKGPWRKQNYVLETADQYPKQICFNAFNDKIDAFNINMGDTVKVSINLSSREYNGRWYTDVQAWRVEKAPGQATANQGPPPEDEGDGTGLPF